MKPPNLIDKEDSAEFTLSCIHTHIEAYERLSGVKLNISVAQEITRKMLEVAYGCVIEEQSEKGKGNPNIHLQRQKELRDMNEAFEVQCSKSNEYHQNLLNKEDE